MTGTKCSPEPGVARPGGRGPTGSRRTGGHPRRGADSRRVASEDPGNLRRGAPRRITWRKISLTRAALSAILFPCLLVRLKPCAVPKAGAAQESGGLGPSVSGSPEKEVIHWTVIAWVRWRWRPRRGSRGAVTHRDQPRSGGTQRRRYRKFEGSGRSRTGALFFVGVERPHFTTYCPFSRRITSLLSSSRFL